MYLEQTPGSLGSSVEYTPTGNNEVIKEPFVNTLKKFEKANALSESESKLLAQQTIHFLQNTEGQYFEDVSELYNSIRHEVVVRRENPLALVQAVEYDEPLEIAFQGGEPYSNAVVWQSSQGREGLQNAFMEGFSSVAGICMVAGYEKDHLTVQKLENGSDANLPKFTSDGKLMSRDYVVAANGSVPASEIDFIVARIPYHYMPEELLRDDEFESGIRFVFRGVLKNKKDILTH